MQITVEIPDHLAREAQARGLSLDRRLAELLAEDLAGTPVGESSAALLPSGAIPVRDKLEMRAFLDAMAAHSSDIPALPDEAFTRESIYQDHD